MLNKTVMKKKSIYIFFILCGFQINFAQDFVIQNQNKIMGAQNPSFYAFGETSKAGVLYNMSEINSQNKIESRFGFANHYFEDNEFSLALDVNSVQINNLGYSVTQANFYYIYKAQLSYEWTFNPSISVGYGNSQLNYNSLVFEDQINAMTGSIAGVTRDPISVNNKVNYVDIGAGAVIRNDHNLFFGLNIKHINRPETSFDSQASNKKDYLVSLQTGYEYDLNPYAQGMLPENSFLFLYNSFTKQGTKSRFDLFQEAILGNVSIGLNEHFNKYDGFTVSQFGTSLSVFIEQLELGVNYSMDVGGQKLGGTSFNTFEMYIIFDFSPFKKNRRGNNSRFYDLN